MIDSITLKISNFIVYEHKKYFPQQKSQNLAGKFGVFGVYTTYYNHHAREQKKLGSYYPQVNIIEKTQKVKGKKELKCEQFLMVQVSTSKLLFGTNLFDVSDELLDVFVLKLQGILKELSIEASSTSIYDAIVTRIDYSKILQISHSYGSTQGIIKVLSAYDYKKSSDFSLNQYRAGRKGSYIKFYNSSQSLTIYDKFDEIYSRKGTKLEQEIKNSYTKGKYTKGALRIELSLQNKRSVDPTLRRFHNSKNKNFTLRDVWQESISQALLIQKIKEVYFNGLNGFVYLSGIVDHELDVLLKEHTKSFNEFCKMRYIAHLIRKVGVKDAKKQLSKELSPATLSRLIKRAEAVTLLCNAKRDKVNVQSYLLRKLERFALVLPKKLKK